jgi:uncharacterized membrane protein
VSELVVIGYDDEFKAEEVRLTLLKLQREDLIDLEDAVVAVRKPSGQVKLNQSLNPPVVGATTGGFWGLLLGAMFLSPLLGVVTGAAAGAISGALADVGINNEFMRALASTMQPGSSVLFVLVRKVNREKVLAELQGTGGKILKTTLADERQASLQAAFDAAMIEKKA